MKKKPLSSKGLIIVHDESELEKLRKYKKKNDVLLILNADDESIEKSGSSGWFDYADKNTFIDIRKDAIDTIRKWGNNDFSKSTLKELLTIEGIPFWSFIESNFSIKLFESSKKMQYIAIIKNAVKTETPDKIIFLDNDSPLSIVCSCIANSTNTKMKKVPDRSKPSQLRRKFRERSYRIAFDMKRKYRRKKSIHKNLPRNGIMVFPSIQTMISMVEPVLNKLKDRNLNHYIVKYDFLNDVMLNDMKERGIGFHDLESWWSNKDKKRIKKIKHKISAIWKRILKDDEFKSKIKYNGIQIWDLVREDFEFYFSTRFRLREIVEYFFEVDNLFKQAKPKLIITLDELSESGLPMAWLAEKHKIPILVIQHGFYYKGGYVIGPSLATKKAVWGPIVKKDLLQRYFTKKQLVITGCPKFDDLVKKTKGNVDEKLLKRMDIDDKSETVLFATQPTAYSKDAAEMFCDVIKKYPEKQVIFKLHPRDMNIDFYRDLCKHLPNKYFITRTTDLYDLIKISSYIITIESTVGLETMIFDRPLITIKTKSETNPNIFSETGSSIEVKNKDELEDILNKIKGKKFRSKLKKNREKFIYDHAYKIDGKSTDRIIALAEEMIGKKINRQ